MIETAVVRVEDRSVVRWGGIAGMAGGVLFLLVFAMVIVVAGPEPTDPAGPIERFPDIRVLRTVENGLYLAVLVLWIPMALALGRALRAAHPAASLFGSTLVIVGLGVLAVGALPHVVTVPLADLYHAPAATAAERGTLVLIWQANQGLFDAFLLAGVLVAAAGVLLLGIAMRAAPAFGGRLAATTMALGAVALASGAAVLADPDSLLAAIAIFALIAFHLGAGWKLTRLATSTTRSLR